MKRLLLYTLIILISFTVHPILGNSVMDVVSQSDESALDETDACPALVQTAMDITHIECNDTGRNQACYGHVMLEARPQPGEVMPDFYRPGNRVDITRLQSLQLSPMNMDESVWGVVLMQIQANLTASRLENVTLLAFGDVQIDNAVGPVTTAEVQVTTRSFVNVRHSPTTEAAVIGSLAPDQTVIALEQLADGSWLRVELEDGTTGWVHADLLSQPEAGSLNIGEARQPYYRPMQAFYYRSSGDNPACPQQQTDGLLIQTPEGVGQISLLINEIDIQIGSTVYFQAQPGGAMTISTLEGEAHIRTGGVTRTAIAGTEVSVPMNENLTPAGPPSPPYPFDELRMLTLPLTALPRSIQPSPALTQAEIDSYFEIRSESIDLTQPGGDSTATGDSVDESSDWASEDEGRPDCPGQSCEAPGQNDDNCPGQSCNAPGQGGTCPGGSCEAPGRAGK